MGGGSGEANEPVSQQHHHVAGDGGHALISRRGLQSDPNGKDPTGRASANTGVPALEPNQQSLEVRRQQLGFRANFHLRLPSSLTVIGIEIGEETGQARKMGTGLRSGLRN